MHHPSGGDDIPSLSAWIATKKKSKSQDLLFFLVAGAGFEPHDLRVMSPTSYRTAPPRDIDALD